MSELPTGVTPQEAPDEDAAPLVEALRGLDPNQVQASINARFQETQAVDPEAGIVIAPLADATPVQFGGQIFRFYGARILPANADKPNYVNPHVHQAGEEPYLILRGTDGEMNTGRIADGQVVWDTPIAVSAGDAIVVKEGQVHSLRNTGDTVFDFAFASPDSHLIDRTPEHPEGDRVFTIGLVGALPPQYPPAN